MLNQGPLCYCWHWISSLPLEVRAVIGKTWFKHLCNMQSRHWGKSHYSTSSLKHTSTAWSSLHTVLNCVFRNYLKTFLYGQFVIFVIFIYMNNDIPSKPLVDSWTNKEQARFTMWYSTVSTFISIYINSSIFGRLLKIHHLFTSSTVWCDIVCMQIRRTEGWLS